MVPRRPEPTPAAFDSMTRITSLDARSPRGGFNRQAATIGPCGPRPLPPGAGASVPGAGAGAGPRSGWNRYALWLAGSKAIVFAPANVGTVSITVYLSAAYW